MSLPESQHSRAARAAALVDSMPHAVWKGDALGRGSFTVSTGHALLDASLPGSGWPPSALTELLWHQQSTGEFRLLAPVLQKLSQAGKPIVLLAPPHIPLAPGISQLGIDLDRILLVQTEKPADRLWAAEQVLKSANFGALLAWLPTARPEHLRRLQLAASAADGLAFMFRPVSTRDEPSPAPLRMICQTSAAGQISVDIIKRRGPLVGEPIVILSKLPVVIQRAFTKPAPAVQPVESSSYAMDRVAPSAVAIGSGVPTLAT